MRKNILADNFTGVYPVSKTLRFRLIPTKKTQEFVERDGVLDTDFHRAQSYEKVKKIIDRYHKEFIERALCNVELQGLDQFYKWYQTAQRSDEQEKEFTKVKKELRKQIAKVFSSQNEYKTLFKKELIKKDLPEYVGDNTEEQALIKEFSDFSTYFTGFYENRKNMYLDEEKSTAIAYRIVHQNLPKYIDNMKIYEQVKNSTIYANIPNLETMLRSKVEIQTIDEYFTLEGFLKVLSQKGIDKYNAILGAYSTQDKNKVQGLNEYINLYNQQHPDKKIAHMKPLFKQILSDKEKISFVLEPIHSDEELLELVEEFYNTLQQNIFQNENAINVGDLVAKIADYNIDKIYISNDEALTKISQSLFSDWGVIKNALEEEYDNAQAKSNFKITQKYVEKRNKALKAKKCYAIGKLDKSVSKYLQQEVHVEDYFSEGVRETLEKIDSGYQELEVCIKEEYDHKKSLIKYNHLIELLKNFLDSVKKLQRILKPMIPGQYEAEKDELFYAELLRIWEELDSVTLLYNRVRNYVTKKPYSLEKVKLNFNKSTLLAGWDRNKERDNLGVILRKDGLYYLGIMNKKCTKIMEQAPEAHSDSRYEKMEYKQLPGANKMLPKVMFAKSNLDKYAPSEELLAKYAEGTHKKGSNFNLQDCHALIDFFKEGIKKNENWAKFDFSFSDTDKYEDISGFYQEVERQGYKLTFRDIDESYINDLVDQGQLYLFQIYNKDFSIYSKGTPNLHTMYWKELFSEENLKNVVYKLNGEAEIFYRKASIKPEDIISHEENELLDNKYPDAVKKKSKFSYKLIKDKRFTVDQYQFYVPVTLNFQAQGENYFNRKVNRLIHEEKDMHVIGIDRGERNLLYISVIDMEGNIKKQMSMNEILSYGKDGSSHKINYHMLLDEREKKNKEARQNWRGVQTIKELKEGYLSQAIHVITDLMIEYNAIVVLEDLNFGFMRGRQKFEKQVYQKFEKMLIDKLNYLVDKHKLPQENGGLLHAYQLTDKFKSFKDMRKQSGFLYYIPAWNTSKLDPTTGFVNLFYLKYDSVEKSIAFLEKFDGISYNKEEDRFEFDIDYSKFTYKAEGSREKWKICTVGDRFENYRNPDDNNKWDTRRIRLTEEFRKLFETYQISIEEDLKKQILQIKEKQFYVEFYRLFRLTLQMRNSSAKENIDKLVSPVMNKRGEFYDSDEYERFDESGRPELPENADANGAYNIARKGLWIIEQIKKTDVDKLDKLKFKITNKEWLKYAQEHTL